MQRSGSTARSDDNGQEILCSPCVNIERFASCYAENSEGERLGRRRKVVPVVEEEKVVLVPVVVVGRRGGGAARSLGWSVG